MTGSRSDIAFSPSIKAAQERLGSRAQLERMDAHRGWPGVITEDLARVVASARSFYLGTASAAGQPYIQHRGGLPGFLRVLDERTLSFADYRGNRQYITVGNLAENPRAFIFLMDYALRRRVKLWGEAHVVENDEALLREVSAVASGASAPERVIVFRLATWDRNCAQHIPRLLPAEEVEAEIASLKIRIAELAEALGEQRRTSGGAA